MMRNDLAEVPVYVPGKKPLGALTVSSNEATQGPLPSVQAAIQQVAAGINRYPDMGAVELRTELARWFSAGSDGSGTWTLDNVAVGNGSSALCQQAILATCHDGDEVLFAWRSFEAYPILSRVVGATPVPVPLTPDHRHDFPAMAEAITPRTRLIFICNPNNPTGTVMTHDEVVEFLERVPSEITVVLDEAYHDYDRSDAAAVHAPTLLRTYPNLLVCRTFSKAYGLAGLRLGYMIGGEDLIAGINRVALPFGVNAAAQAAGLASIAADEELQERVELTVAQRDRLLRALPEALRVPSQGNFLWLPVNDRAAELDAALREQAVVARCFAGGGVRVTVTTAEEVDRILEVLPGALAALGYEVDAGDGASQPGSTGPVVNPGASASSATATNPADAARP